MNARAIASALFAIPSQSPTITSPIDAASTTMLAENAVNATDTASIPAPANAQPTPNNVTAPATFTIVPARGLRTAVATPRTVNAPASANNAAPIFLIDMLPSILSTGVITAKDDAATVSAADAAKVPFIAFKPTARTAIDPPRATMPFAIASQDIPPILTRAAVRMFKDVLTITRPLPMLTMFLGISRTAIVTAAREPPIAVNPLAISLHFIAPKSAAADANIFIAAPISIRARLVATTFFAFPVSFVNAAISASKTPIEAKPFAMPIQSNSAKSAVADANILIAAAKAIMPTEVDMAFLSIFAVLRNRSSSRSSPPTPVKPFASSSQLRRAISAQAEASIFIADENITMLVAPFITRPSILDIAAAAPTSIAIRPSMPVKPTASSFQSRLETFFNALASINTDVDKPSIMVIAFETPEKLRFSLLRTASAAIISTNNAVMPANEVASLSASISEITTNEAARIAIAVASSFNVFALRFCCQAFKAPFTPSRIPVMLPRILPTPPKASDNPFVNLTTLTNIAANKPPFKRSNRLPRPSILKISLSADITIEATFFTAPAIFCIKPQIPLRISRKDWKPFASIFCFTA